MRLTYLLFAALALLLALTTLPTADARIREGECEVCLRLVEEFKEATKVFKDNTEAKVETRIKQLCDKKTDQSERRLCYYIGGSKDAATYLLGTISKPILNHLPPTKICDKLKSIDPEICKVKYEKPEEAVDYSKVDFASMRVRELKDVLKKWNEQCVNCIDKNDYLATIKEVLPKYIKQAAATVSEKISEL